MLSQTRIATIGDDNDGSLWLNSSNITAHDATYASEILTGASDRLTAFVFGFSIPPNSLIRGILVEVSAYAISTVADTLAKLWLNGSEISSDKSTSTTLTTTPPYPAYNISYGGTYDLWGITLTAAQINDPNFGFNWSATRTGSPVSQQVFLDDIRMTVYYLPSLTKNLTLFNPNTSTNIPLMFTSPDQWANARKHIQIFSMFPPNLAQTTVSGNVDTNDTWPMIRDSGAITMLKNWGIPLATSATVYLTPDGGTTLNNKSADCIVGMNNVAGQGSSLDFITLNEPAAYGKKQGVSNARSLIQVNQFISDVQAVNPDVYVGLYEPYPYSGPTGLPVEGMTVGEILTWLGMYKPDYFHIDVNFPYLFTGPAAGIDYTSDLRTIRNYCESNGIPFGIVMNSVGAVASNADYFSQATHWWQVILKIYDNVEPMHRPFVAWVDATTPISGGTSLRWIPDNVPETTPNTHTYFVNSLLDPSKQVTLGKTGLPLRMGGGIASYVIR